MAVGAGIGAIGGTVDAIIYSNDNQDYSQFLNRVEEGVVIGISAASLGMAIRAAIDYKPLDKSTREFLDSLDNDIQKFMYDERTNLNDLDRMVVKHEKAEKIIQVAKEAANDSFRFSNELAK